MKTKVMFPIAVMLFAAACGRDSVTRVDQKDYEVVQEGSANGVTSTIQGPGEILPPVTGTNFDTTTAFGIDPSTAASTPPPLTGTFAGTSPAPYTPPGPRTEPVAPAPRPESQTPRPPVTPAPVPEPRVEPPTMTDTATVPEPAPAPEQEPEEEDEGEDEENPPPTTTDTRGQ